MCEQADRSANPGRGPLSRLVPRRWGPRLLFSAFPRRRRGRGGERPGREGSKDRWPAGKSCRSQSSLQPVAGRLTSFGSATELFEQPTAGRSPQELVTGMARLGLQQGVAPVTLQHGRDLRPGPGFQTRRTRPVCPQNTPSPRPCLSDEYIDPTPADAIPGARHLPRSTWPTIFGLSSARSRTQ